MNPLTKLILAAGLAVEITFVASIPLNLALLATGLLLVIFQYRSPVAFWILILVPFLPALGDLIAQFRFGSPTFGWVIFTRIYAYVALSTLLVQTTSLLELANAFEQKWHVPTQFIFGMLAGFHLLPEMVHQTKIIRASANMRGVHLTFCSPRLYFKAILSALRSSEQLAEAMEAHGFQAGAPRTHLHSSHFTARDGWESVLILIGSQLCLFI